MVDIKLSNRRQHGIVLRWRNENSVLNRWRLTLIRQVMMLMTLVMLSTACLLLTAQVLSFFLLLTVKDCSGHLRCINRFDGLYSHAYVWVSLTCLYRAIPDFRLIAPNIHSEAGAFLSEYITKQSELYVDIMKYDYTSHSMLM